MQHVKIWLQAGQRKEMCRIERQKITEFMHSADRDQPSIMHLLSNDPSVTYKSLPGRINVWRLWEQ